VTLTLREYLPVKQLHESKALALRDATPINEQGKHVLHLADASAQVLRLSPSLWLLYQEAIAAGHPSEFQRPKRQPTRPTPADRVWFAIERLARTLVAASAEPMTLRTAVVRVVELRPELLERYRNAIRRTRRASAGGR
jgi:hypothetical protein